MLKLGKDNKIEIKYNTIQFGSDSVHIFTYIPTKQKMDLIDALKMEVLNEPILNQVKLDALIDMYIIKNYTDIKFDSLEINDLLEYYDYLQYNGYIDEIFKAIPRDEMETMRGYIADTIKDFNIYKVSCVGLMESLVTNLPVLKESVKDLIDTLDDDKIANVMSIYNNSEH